MESEDHTPRRLRGGSSRCEVIHHGHACGARATWWDGHRFVCSACKAEIEGRQDR